MTLIDFLFACLSVAGWAHVLTTSDGPWKLIARLRAAWTGGPLGCPTCTGTWLGIAAALAIAAAQRWPAIDLPLVAVAWGGVGAAVSKAYDMAIYLAATIGWLVTERAKGEEKDPRAPEA